MTADKVIHDYLDGLTKLTEVEYQSKRNPLERSSITEYRLANLFARDRREQERLLVAFRRALSGQHLTLEYRIILNDQLLKVLHAARRSEAKLMHLRILLGDYTQPNDAESELHEALSPQASSSLLRLSRILDPANANILKRALQMMEEGQRLDLRRIRMIVEAFNTLLSVFESHPELINVLRAKQQQDSNAPQQVAGLPA